jgi:hypothetical protein
MDKQTSAGANDERAEIGTPAGESPEKGRSRHGTTPKTETTLLAATKRGFKHNLEEDSEEVDFVEDGDEISTTGGLTGTHVKGGVPSGGTTEGGTLGKPKDHPAYEDKK